MRQPRLNAEASGSSAGLLLMLIVTATLRELPPITRARRAYAPDATAPAEWDFRWSGHETAF
jgi:hypothetical protein